MMNIHYECSVCNHCFVKGDDYESDPSKRNCSKCKNAKGKIRLHGTKIIGTGVISDYLPGGVNGMLSHADGKRYDSKSQYERAVKAKGCRVVGNDFNGATYKTPLERGVRGEFNVRPHLKEAVQRVLN